MSKSSAAAAQYARMTDVERCAMAGKLMRRTWYARVYQPDAVDRLLTCKVCKLPPSVENRPCEQCKPKHRVARESQIPDWIMPGREKVRTQIVLGGRSSGKDLAIDTPILTANRGWQTMGSIRVGDVVFDELGAQCNVTFISEINNEKPMYRLTFSDGSELVASDTHEWITTTHAQRKAARRRQVNADRGASNPGAWSVQQPSPITTLDIISTLKYGSRGDTNHAIAVAQPLQYDEGGLLVDPYTIGVWLGDGSTLQRDIHLGDRDAEEILGGVAVEEGWSRKQNEGACTAYRLPMDDWKRMYAYDLPGHKHIPVAYKEATVESRKALLAGIIDTDGYISEDSKCEVTLCNEVLANDVYDLVLGLGFRATMKESDAKIDGLVVGRRWRTCFSITPEHEVPLRVKFKASRVSLPEKQQSRIYNRMINDVTRTANVPCRCIAVDSPSHLYLAGRTLIPTHNTMAASGWWIPEILERPNYRLSIIGPSFKISERVGILGVSGLKTLIEAFDPTLIQSYNKVDKILTLVNGSEVFCFTSENTSSIEGPEYHGLWVDEVAELMGAGGDDCIYRVKAEPGVRLVGDKGEAIRKIVTGTPDATELIKNLHQSAEDHPDRYGFRELATRENFDNVDRVMFEQMYEETDKSSIHYISKLEGKLVLSSPHALLTEPQVAAIRCPQGDPRRKDPADMEKVVLAVDANHSDDVKSDECGIIVVGRYQGRGYVFADASTKGGSDVWGEQIIAALIAYPEIREVACEDEGLVIDVVTRILSDDDALERIGRTIKIRRMKHGNKSKKQRADPVSALYVRKRMLHCACERTPDWSLEKLEWQWVSWNPNKTGTKAKSPDRIDACTYGATRLLLRDATPDSFYKPSDVGSWGH